jgi:metal iron transporter
MPILFYSTSSDGVRNFLIHERQLLSPRAGAATIFALALLCAGQSASLVATVAGQIVAEGFIRWRLTVSVTSDKSVIACLMQTYLYQPLMRRLLTRLLGLIPSMVVAVAVGPSGVNTMLVASQVVLSIALPFIIFPLVWLTSSRTVMRVYVPASTRPARKEDDMEEEKNENVAEGEYLYLNNGWVIAGIGYFIWAVIVLANGYVLVTLMLGEGGN